MAEEKKTPEKANKNWFMKLIDWFKALPGRIATAFKNMVAELRKVTWPSKKKLISSCIVVILFMVVVGAIIGLLDVVSATLVDKAYEISHDSGNVITTDDLITTEDATVEEEHDHEGETVTDETVVDETIVDGTVEPDVNTEAEETTNTEEEDPAAGETENAEPAGNDAE